MININKLNPLHTRCYQKVSNEIKLKKATIKSHDNARFAHAVVAALYPAQNNLQLECILEKDDSAQSGRSYRYQHHKVFSIGYYVHCNYNNTMFKYHAYRGKDGVIDWFVNELKNVIERIKFEYGRYVQMEKRSQSEWNQILNSSSHCSICEKAFTPDDDNGYDVRVRDHCHLQVNFEVSLINRVI